MILCNVALAPVPIHSLFSSLKSPLFWPYMVIWREILISLINCNLTPFYPIEMGFSPEIIEFYTENKFKIFTIFFLNFFSDAKFGPYLGRHNSSYTGWNRNQLTGNSSTYFPAKFRHIRCILLLSISSCISQNSRFWEVWEEKP